MNKFLLIVLMQFFSIIIKGQALNYYGKEFIIMRKDIALSCDHLYFCGSNSATIQIVDTSNTVILQFSKAANSCDSISFIPITGTGLSGSLFKMSYKIISSDSINVYESSSIDSTSAIYLLAIPPTNINGSSFIETGYHTISLSQNYYEHSFIYLTSLQQDSLMVNVYPNKPHPLLVTPPYFQVSIPHDKTWINQVAEDLTGTIIESIPGSQYQCVSGRVNINGQRPVWNLDGPIVNYLLPLEYSGFNYHTVPHVSRIGDLYRASAFQDSTILTLNDSIFTINRGEILDTILYTASTWSSNKKISLLQFSRNQTEDSVYNSSSFFYPVYPDEAKICHSLFTTEIVSDLRNIIQNRYINLTCLSTDTANIFLDNIKLVGFSNYNTDTLWCYKQLLISSGTHELVADSGVIAVLYGYGPSVGYGTIVSGDKILNSVGYFEAPDSPFNIKIYPNPTTDKVHLSINGKNERLCIKTYDVLGKIIDEKIFYDNEIDVNFKRYSKGIYFLEISNPINVQVYKIVKN